MSQRGLTLFGVREADIPKSTAVERKEVVQPRCDMSRMDLQIKVLSSYL
jgi:hypothetical protein